MDKLPEAPVSANTRIKSPNGFVWQFTIRENKASDLITKMKVLEKSFLEADWNPASFTPTSTQKPATDAKKCPKCGSDMWDNRPKKASGEFKAKSPDFKCKDSDCGHVIWPPKKGG